MTGERGKSKLPGKLNSDSWAGREQRPAHLCAYLEYATYQDHQANVEQASQGGLAA